MQIVYRSRDIAEAHIVAGMLQADAMDAFVGGHYLQGGIGELGVSDFAVVWVQDKDYDAARLRLQEYEASLQNGVARSKHEATRPTSLLSVSYIMLGFLFCVLLLISLVA